MTAETPTWREVPGMIVDLIRLEIEGRKMLRIADKHRAVDDSVFGKACLTCGVESPCPPLVTNYRRFKDQEWSRS